MTDIAVTGSTAAGTDALLTRLAKGFVSRLVIIVPYLWLLFFFVVITLGELYLSPIGLALVARVAPPQILSMMMGMWFITSFIGNLLQGYIGSFFSAMDKTHFFLLCALIGGVAGAVTWLFDRPLRSVLESRSGPAVVVTAEPQAEPHLELHAGG